MSSAQETSPFAAIRYLIVALTERCNLRCKGCLQGAGSEGADMEWHVLEPLLERIDCGQPLLIQITGGEPTLLPEMIAELARRTRRFRNIPRLALQTNGTLLTMELVELCRTYNIEVGVSVDGTPELQQRLRGGSNATLKGLQLLERAKLPFRVTTLLSGENCRELRRLLLFLAGFGCCRGVGFDLLVQKGRGTGLPAPSAEQLEQAGRELAALLPLLNSRRNQPLLLRELELLKRGGGGAFCHAASGRSLAVTPKGELYPCGQTMGDEAFFLGSVARPQLEGIDRDTAVLGQQKLIAPECFSCVLAQKCPGDCPSRLYYNRDASAVCGLYRGLAAGAAV